MFPQECSKAMLLFKLSVTRMLQGNPSVVCNKSVPRQASVKVVSNKSVPMQSFFKLSLTLESQSNASV